MIRPESSNQQASKSYSLSVDWHTVCWWITEKYPIQLISSILNKKENDKKVIQIIVEWDLSLKEEFKSKLVKEQIIENYSFIKNFNYVSKPVPLITLIDNFVKSGTYNFI